MNLSKITIEQINKLKEKSSIKSLIEIMHWNSTKVISNDSLRIAATEAIISIGDPAKPELEKVFLKVIKKWAAFGLNPYFITALDKLGSTSLLINTILECLKENGGKVYSVYDTTLLACLDVLSKRDKNEKFPEPFIWVLYNSIVKENWRSDHKKSIKKAMQILKNDIELKDEKFKFIYETAKIKNKHYLTQFLDYAGWNNTSFGKSDSLSNPVKTIDYGNKYIDYLLNNPEITDKIDFLKEYVLKITRDIFKTAAILYVPLNEVFKKKSGALGGYDMSYQLPLFCAGCLSHDADYPKEFTESIGEYMNMYTVKVKINFCNKCKSNADKIIISDYGSLIFLNPIYGYKFAKLNSVKNYQIENRLSIHSEFLSNHLKKMGAKDTTLGIPLEMVEELKNFSS